MNSTRKSKTKSIRRPSRVLGAAAACFTLTGVLSLQAQEPGKTAAPPKAAIAAEAKVKGPSAPEGKAPTGTPKKGPAAEAKVKHKGQKHGDKAGKAPMSRAEAMKLYHEATRAAVEARGEMTPEQRKKVAEELKEARAGLRAAHREDVKEFREMTKEKRSELKEKLRTRLKDLHATRKARAEKARAEIRKAWGEKLKADGMKGAMKDELTRHAWRVARLRQLIAMAHETGKPELEERAKKLLEKEAEGHKARMGAIANGKKTEKAAPPTAPAAPSVPAAEGGN